MSEKYTSRGSSIFWRYLVSLFLVIAVVFTVLGTSLMVFVASYWKNETIDLLKENVIRIAEASQEYFNLDEEMGYKSPKVMLAYSLSLVSSSINSDIYIVDLEGNAIVCKDMQYNILAGGACEEHKSHTLPQSLIENAMDSTYVHLGEVGDVYDKSYLVVCEPIKVNGDTIAIVVGASPSVAAMTPYVASITKMFLLSAVVALVVAGVCIYITTYSLTKPLRKMANVTKSYAKGDFSTRIDVKGHDELATLALSLNKMAQSLSALEYSRRSFIANVSHELKTPMTTIGGFIDGILDGTISRDEEEKYLKIVSDEVKRLSRLVASMLNLSKIEAGEMKIELKEIDLSSLLFNSLLTFEKAINDKSIEITGLDSMQSVTVYADEGLIHQVLYNLIDNAVKFTPAGGTIDVRTSKDDNYTTVHIRNSGNGIPKEEIGRIFERFYKVDKSRSYDVKSTGLGLYIVKSIVEMHSGKVGADSKEGEYTEFFFSLPNANN
ncbi:MAG: HAMP domain-containing histidine kinase [Clostridia bacterium]|nr:HAMP domain-containing histidine kinase [Clostridia bacterium]